MEVWINSRLLLALGLAVSDAAQVYYLTPDARECMDRLKSSGMYRCVFRPQFCVLCFSRSTISMAGQEFRIIWLKARVICSDPRSDGSLKRCSWRKQKTKGHVEPTDLNDGRSKRLGYIRELLSEHEKLWNVVIWGAIGIDFFCTVQY